MARRKSTDMPDEALRTRLTIYPDGNGCLSYLKGVNPSGLNMELLRLIHMGYLLQLSMSGGGAAAAGVVAMPVAVPAVPGATAAPLLTSETGGVGADAKESSREEVVPGSPFSEDFKTMFGAAFERTRKPRAHA